MRARIVYWFLLLIKVLSRLFYRYEGQWVGEVPPNPWREDFRLVAILNHTSLFEFLYAGIVPNRFLERMARYSIVPIASKTIDRPLIGLFWRFIGGNVISISRERDDTWTKVLESIDPRSMIIILPEGRMKRANGLDSQGKPLMVRGGIADLIEAIPDGRMLLAYSQGLHHVQIPDQSPVPRLFQPVAMRFEVLDIAEYRAALRRRKNGGSFRATVIEDLTRRRDTYCTSDVGARDEPRSLAACEPSSSAVA